MTPLAIEIYDRVGSNNHETAEATETAWLDRPAFALAFRLWSRGYSVIPLSHDGKRPTRKWKRYQTERCSVLDLIDWFIDHDFWPAIVTGALSGVTVIDCDSLATVRFWEKQGPRPLMTQETRRGRHFVYRHNGERNTVRVNGIEGIDRRGEGGYVKAYYDSMFWEHTR